MSSLHNDPAGVTRPQPATPIEMAAATEAAMSLLVAVASDHPGADAVRSKLILTRSEVRRVLVEQDDQQQRLAEIRHILARPAVRAAVRAFAKRLGQDPPPPHTGRHRSVTAAVSYCKMAVRAGRRFPVDRLVLANIDAAIRHLWQERADIPDGISAWAAMCAIATDRHPARLPGSLRDPLETGGLGPFGSPLGFSPTTPLHDEILHPLASRLDALHAALGGWRRLPGADPKDIELVAEAVSARTLDFIEHERLTRRIRLAVLRWLELDLAQVRSSVFRTPGIVGGGSHGRPAFHALLGELAQESIAEMETLDSIKLFDHPALVKDPGNHSRADAMADGPEVGHAALSGSLSPRLRVAKVAEVQVANPGTIKGGGEGRLREPLAT